MKLLEGQNEAPETRDLEFTPWFPQSLYLGSETLVISMYSIVTGSSRETMQISSLIHICRL